MYIISIHNVFLADINSSQIQWNFLTSWKKDRAFVSKKMNLRRKKREGAQGDFLNDPCLLYQQIQYIDQLYKKSVSHLYMYLHCTI